MHDSIIVHQPTTTPAQLILLFHGVGSRAEDLQPLGQALGRHFADAFIVSVRSPDASDLGAGWQWFSVRGVDEANRVTRVADTMPRFVQTVQYWQGKTRLAAAATTLIGFSQGAIMALESTQQPVPLARSIMAIAGRFAQSPRHAPTSAHVHLMHGDTDPVMPTRLSELALAQLLSLGGSATLDRFPGLGHGIDARVLERIIERMRESTIRPEQ